MTRTILLVEDNPDDAELTASVLRDHSLDAIIDLAEDGLDALEYLAGTGRHAASEPRLPDLMLLDLKLPRMSGLELLAQLRADPRTRLIPVVILTSSLEDDDVARGYALGANSYVRKPVDYDEFVVIARKLGEFWLDVNHPPMSPGR
ncbi:MAG: response regulator [Deltaproteobacteria bacterium]|nr:response regulator [Deltaproteobacteria bacterium]